jgi:hypothetical protein
MTQFKKQLVGALATGLLVAQILAPVAYADDGINLTVTGNGAKSDSTINAAVSNNTAVSQTNTANVTNTVDSKSNSGDNKATGNTSGDVLIKTGNATSDVTVANNLNTNVANVNCCGAKSTDVAISGNGTKSDNNVNLSQGNSNAVAQTNVANVLNNVDSKANSGENKANANTGGDVTILTGAAKAGADVTTHANTNVANIGGGNMGDQGGVSLMISGNGAKSDNNIALALSNANSIEQTNVANVENDVNAKANSGENKANDNTGGDVAILTGKADAMVGVDNNVNFNWADIDCGCVTDLTAKIAGNGKKSDNAINASLDNVKVGDQTNVAALLNDVYAKAKTGENKAEANTGAVAGNDPAIMTGDSSSNTSVGNSSNWNVFGNGDITPVPMPEFDFNVDWSAFMFWMGSNHSN